MLTNPFIAFCIIFVASLIFGRLYKDEKMILKMIVAGTFMWALGYFAEEVMESYSSKKDSPTTSVVKHESNLNSDMHVMFFNTTSKVKFGSNVNETTNAYAGYQVKNTISGDNNYSRLQSNPRDQPYPIFDG